MEDRGGRKGTGAWEPCSWHQAWPLGPRYCCCYELGGGAAVVLWGPPLTWVEDPSSGTCCGQPF